MMQFSKKTATIQFVKIFMDFITSYTITIKRELLLKRSSKFNNAHPQNITMQNDSQYFET